MAADDNHVPDPTPRSSSKRLRLLLMAYYCQPNRGSEFGAGWNRALECAKDCDTWVISRNGPTADRTREFFAAHGEIPGLNFAFVELPGWQERLLELPWIKWIMARWWHRKALELARRLHAEHKFDLVQHVTCISYREPGELWKLDIPFVWGPIGGADSIPWNFLLEGGFVSAVGEGLRSMVNVVQMHFSRRIRHATRHADYILFANSVARRWFKKVHHVSGPLLQDVSIRRVRETPRDARRDGGPLRILWSGALESRKCLSLLLKALAEMPPEVEYRLRILGEGTMELRWKRQAAKLGVADRVEWLGWLPLTEAHSNYDWADVFVFTSLRDTGGNVNLEAMANSLPVICLDHQGVHDMVCPDCGVKVPVTTPRQVTLAIRDALVKIAGDPDLRAAMGREALERSKHFLWSRNREEMLRIYEEVLEKRSQAHVTLDSSDVRGTSPASSRRQSRRSTEPTPVGSSSSTSAEVMAVSGVQSPS